MSIRQRLAGFFEAIGLRLNQTVDVRIVSCDHWEDHAGYCAVQNLLKSGYRPDVILTPGDQLAIGAYKALQENGFSIPEDTSIIAGNGVEPLTREIGLTRLELPVQQIGVQTVAMLKEMIEQQKPELPGRYLDIPITIGTSTTDEENEILQSI